MTSKPVNGAAGNLQENLPVGRAAQPAARQNKTGGHFSDVLQKQTALPKLGAQENAGASASRTKLERQGGRQTAKEQDVKPADTEDVSEQEEVSGEEKEQAVKAVEELASQLMAQLASQLGISVEEVEELLAGMELAPADLLQPGVLTQVLLAAGGESDEAALLTNEQLYVSLQELNGTLQEGLEQIAEATGMEISEIREQLERLSGQTAETEPVPENLPETAAAGAEETEADAARPADTAGAAADGADMPETDGGRIMLERSRNESHQEEGHRNTEEGTGNFVQNFQAQQTAEVSEAPVPVESRFSEDTRMIMNQILDFMKFKLGDGLTQLEMQLHPENLGTLQIQIASRHGVLTAQFTAQNEAVKAALESQMTQLQEQFEEQGVKVEAIEVTVQSHAFERNLEQGNQEQHQAEQQEAARSRIRRLHLGSPEETPEEELSEADRLAADMMAQSGNSVDYTV